MDNYNSSNEEMNQNQYSSPALEQNSKKKIWLIILIPIIILILGVVVFFIFNQSSKTISENEFTKGTKLKLEETKEAKFIIDDEEHTIKVNSVSGDSVNLVIQSNPIQVDIKIGETKKFDLNDDGFYDLQIKLNGIEDGVPEIYVKKIQESTGQASNVGNGEVENGENKCTEDWDCSEWGSCSEQESQTRTCTDLNSCGTTTSKPSTTQSCTYVEGCTDSDGGEDYYTKGTVVGYWIDSPEAGEVTKEDFCFEGQWTNLQEFTCEVIEGKSGILQWGYNCPNGCSDGACIS